MIREMVYEDIETVFSIEQETFSMPWSKSSFIECVYSEYDYAFVYEAQDIVLGYVIVQFVVDTAHLINIAVSESHRGQGIGKELLKFVIEYFKNKLCEKIFLDVRVSNKNAIKLYENFGFEKVFIQKNLYERPTEDGYLMELKI